MPPLQLTKEQLIPLLEELAVLLEFKGENPFKSRAYANAAKVLETMGSDLGDAIETRSLLQQKGIGESMFETISKWASTGHSLYYEEVKATIPPGLFEMLNIRGLGIKKIRQIHETLGINNLVDLEYACIENRLTDLPGFGKKTQEKIQNNITFYRRHQGCLRANTAREAASILLSQLRQISEVKQADVVGALRRKNEIVDRLEIIASSASPAVVKAAFCTAAGIEPEQCQSTAHAGFEIVMGTMKDGISLTLYLVPEDRFAFLLHHFTGNDAYQKDFVRRANQFGLKVSEYGLFLGDHLLPCQNEHDLFSTLDLHDIPPELREGRGEIDAAANHALPHLVTEKDIRGIFHVHSTYSDGSASLFDMVAAAERAGFEYIGISDHSQSAFYANGLKPDRVRKQHEEIDTLRRQFPKIFIFKGIESDILADGSLDYDDATLSSFDFVIASVHSHFNMDEEEMTRRVIRAMAHPAVTLLGHPTGRLLLSREGYPLDIPAVIEAARRYSVAIELNASPYRLDLDWRYCKLAKEAGVLLSLNPDAHQIESMTDLFTGVGIARKAWLSPEDLLNTLCKEDVASYLKNRRKPASSLC